MGLEAEPEKRSRGEYVEVFGLQSQTGRRLNQKRGIVIRTNEDTSRIEVCLAEGKSDGSVTSLRPECLRLVADATAEEIQDAKDEAGPALRAGQEIGAPPDHDIRDQSELKFANRSPPRRERSRSWSPPPETVRAAAVAGQQAAGAALSRGLSTAEAEALGSTAAEQFLARSKQQGHSQKQGGQSASTNKAARSSGASVSNAAASFARNTPTSLQDLKVGDSVQVVGLKGADAAQPGQCFVIEQVVVLNGLGKADSRKYVVSTNKLVINAQGDLAEEKVMLAIAGKNIRLPGDDSAFVGSSDESVQEKAGGFSKKPAAGFSKKSKSKKRSAKRSRSRRKKSKRARSSSSSSSTSSRPTRHVKAEARGKEPAPASALSKADKLRKFGFQTQQPHRGGQPRSSVGSQL